MRHMDTNLVCAPRFQLDLQQAESCMAFQYAVMGDGGFATINNCHPYPVFRMPANWRIDIPPDRHLPDHDSPVFAADTARLDAVYQLFMRLHASCYYHDATGVFVQAVHDP